MGPGSSLPFPTGSIPITATTFVSIFSPTASLISTCKLVAVGDEELQVELIAHVHLNPTGKPVTTLDAIIPGLIIGSIILPGFAGCGLIWRRTRKQRLSRIDAAGTYQEGRKSAKRKKHGGDFIVEVQAGMVTNRN